MICYWSANVSLWCKHLLRITRRIDGWGQRGAVATWCVDVTNQWRYARNLMISWRLLRLRGDVTIGHTYILARHDVGLQMRLYWRQSCFTQPWAAAPVKLQHIKTHPKIIHTYLIMLVLPVRVSFKVNQLDTIKVIQRKTLLRKRLLHNTFHKSQPLTICRVYK